jgi:hypothetical protein
MRLELWNLNSKGKSCSWMMIFTGHTSVQLPPSVEANGKLLSFAKSILAKESILWGGQELCFL